MAKKEKTIEYLIKRIEREKNRMFRHQLEIKNNIDLIERTKKLLLEKYNYVYQSF